MPISAARATICTLPRMALAMPPPASPGDSGSFVKKFQSSDLPPLYTRKPRMTKSVVTVTAAQMPVRVSITLFTVLRQASDLPFGFGILSGRSFPRSGDYQKPGEAVDDNGEQEKHEAKLHQS